MKTRHDVLSVVRCTTISLFAVIGVSTTAFPQRADTSLLEAAKTGDTKTIQALVQQGVNVNLPIEEPPLMLAAQNGHDEAVKLLLAAGAKINVHAFNGATALV
jgi:ankyrin repeat protein